ncbi:O(6)-methylguanine-induced apoptosis 2-like [Sycon ciliatum]|uniref:O(6)-methylguanine-induced apoptosis 2-like n=1 Tax=Sycon ciliatum TaxID=27933 RepID=UPI0031F686B2
MASRHGDSVEWVDANEWRDGNKRTRPARPLATTAHERSADAQRGTGQGSIPTKYRTVFYPRDDRKGFMSTTTRFQDTAYEANDCPGPGAYKTANIGSVARSDTTSLSQKGTGNFASKCQRFTQARPGAVAPNSYNAADAQKKLDRHDFRQAETTRVFRDDLVPASFRQRKDTGPAPNKYSVLTESKPVPAAASFKAKCRREPVELHTAANPAPGQYNTNMSAVRPKPPQGYNNLFRSTVPRTIFPPPKETPGPGAYDSHVEVQIRRPAQLQNHYLCLSAPAIPLPAAPAPPGPTKYNLQELSSFNTAVKVRPDPSFKSKTGRWRGETTGSTTAGIGPGTYSASAPAKQSFLLNLQSKWTT